MDKGVDIKSLILLTSKFPCAKGEEFLESEIGFLSNEFDRILVIPTYLGADTQQTRTLPGNAQLLLPADLSHSKVRSLAHRIKDALRSGMVRKRPGLRWLLDMRFAVTTLGLVDRISIALEEASLLDESKDAVLYAYWMFKPAAVAVLLRDHLLGGNSVAITRAHRYDVYPELGIRGYLPARPFLASKIDHFYPISESAAVEIRKLPRVRADKVEVARLGVYGPKSIDRHAYQEPIHFVSCSTLASVKRIEDMISAFKILSDISDCKFRWTHLGDSGSESLEAVRGRIREVGLDDVVEFAGYVTNQRVLELYSSESFSFFVNFSSSEGVPVSIMEAFAFGIPAIATDVGGTSELVREGKNGFLLASDSTPNDLASALYRVTDLEPEDLQKLSNSARKTWESMADANRNYPNFAKAIAQLN